MTTYIKPTATGATYEGEYKDCTVRALANAGNIPYLEAHSIMKSHGRLNRHGAYPNQYTPAYLENGFELVGICGTTHHAKYSKNTMNSLGVKVNALPGIGLKKFLEKYDDGSYIVIVSGHAVAIIDGETVDKGYIPEGKRVTTIFKKV